MIKLSVLSVNSVYKKESEIFTPLIPCLSGSFWVPVLRPFTVFFLRLGLIPRRFGWEGSGDVRHWWGNHVIGHLLLYDFLVWLHLLTSNLFSPYKPLMQRQCAHFRTLVKRKTLSLTFKDVKLCIVGYESIYVWRV